MFSHLKEDINCVFDRDPAARNMFEILTTYPGIHAIIFYRFTNWLWIRHWKWLSRFLAAIARWLTGIEIHPGATIGRRFFIDHGMGVVIGETAVIGDDCTLYHGVTLGGTTWQKGKRHPTLGNNVVVGAGAKVLGPILIGDGARIGSNAVVVKPVPENATAIGIPAKIIEIPKDALEKRRLETAKKIGFDAYGTSNDMPDPVLTAINRILDHLHAVDHRMDRMCETLRRQDPNFGENEQLPNLDGCELHAQADDLPIK